MATQDADLYVSPEGDDEPHVGDPGRDDPELTLAEWRERGNDRHSVVADPAPGELDAPLPGGETAAELGIEPVDPSEAGPRERPGANRRD